MIHTFDLSKNELQPLTEYEMYEIDGGSWWDKVVLAVTTGPIAVAFAVVAVVDTAITLGQGMVDGWNAAKAVHSKK